MPHVLAFEGVTLLSTTHSEPWGPSSCVNATSIEGGRFRVEMQSGDILEIEATSYSFSAHPDARTRNLISSILAQAPGANHAP
jgi:hypothetical protein